MSPRDRRQRSHTSAAGDPGLERTTTGLGELLPGAVALVLVGIGLAVINQESQLRGMEARTGADLARLVGLVPARAVGSSVIFPLQDRSVGYTVSAGCAVAFFVAPFFFIAATLIVSRRTPPRRGLGALAIVVLVFFAVNQARLFVVAASMRVWGFQSGYERSHIFLGTMISTVGVVVGLLLFVWLLAKDGSRKRDRPGRWAAAA